jgi:hypothetical protein
VRASEWPVRVRPSAVRFRLISARSLRGPTRGGASGCKLSVPLALASLDSRRGEGSGDRLGVVPEMTFLSHRGPAARIPLAPARSQSRVVRSPPATRERIRARRRAAADITRSMFSGLDYREEGDTLNFAASAMWQRITGRDRGAGRCRPRRDRSAVDHAASPRHHREADMRTRRRAARRFGTGRWTSVGSLSSRRPS